MLKYLVVAVAAVAFFQVQPATAQHWHEYGHGAHHRDDHGHYYGYHHRSHHYDHDDTYTYRSRAAIALGYVDMPLNQHHGAADVYCPNDFGCPSQHNQPAFGGLSQQNPPYQDAPYLGAPRQHEVPNGMAGSVGSYNDHGHHANDGHNPGDHSHDGHEHGLVNPSPENPAVTFETPDRQPMTAPTLPNRNTAPELPRYQAPRDRPAQPSSPSTDDRPIRMDGPPPTLTALSSLADAVS